jgi:hypothetical protein
LRGDFSNRIWRSFERRSENILKKVEMEFERDRRELRYGFMLTDTKP